MPADRGGRVLRAMLGNRHELMRLLDDIRESGDPDETLPADFLEVWEPV